MDSVTIKSSVCPYEWVQSPGSTRTSNISDSVEHGTPGVKITGAGTLTWGTDESETSKASKTIAERVYIVLKGMSHGEASGTYKFEAIRPGAAT